MQARAHRIAHTPRIDRRPSGTRPALRMAHGLCHGNPYPRHISRHPSALDKRRHARRHGPTHAQAGSAPRGGHHASTFHGQHPMGHAARGRRCRHCVGGHATHRPRRPQAIVLRGHRRRVRRRMASGRADCLPHRQCLGQQQRGRRGSELHDRAGHDPPTCTGSGRQYQRASAHRRRLRLREQQGAGRRRRNRRPLVGRRRYGNRRTLDGLRRRHHARPLPQQQIGPRHHAGTSSCDQQRDGTTLHEQQLAGPRSSARQIA
ncbi:hypothetical protein LMG18101_02463 [Ralstonia flaminis]|jgi:hypothetical protein|uniref:Uncharacterized protein n=1 Tax=Ralstonia flaminis TaxID=3058597 RepID=A0ABN9JNC2_9RALS|nr:hypothetical protein LMG18101_02463 [Ralstonia sp. LMG 18101]